MTRSTLLLIAIVIALSLGAPRPVLAQAGMGPDNKPAVDAAAADRGRKVYASQCITCHGTQGRGTETGANLVRSVLILHDRVGTELGPFLKKGHPTQSGAPSAGITDAEVKDLAHFIRQRVNDTLRGSPIFDVQNILTGNVKAGQTFFNGAGGCATCHSPTGNLAGIGTRLTPVNIQQRMLFPPGPGRGGRGAPAPAPNAVSPIAVSVTVTPQGRPAISGVLVHMDDFSVSLRDSGGAFHSFQRTPTLKVDKQVPLAAHIAMLDTITDTQIHDLVAYLEALK